jgi:hypothetical protein
MKQPSLAELLSDEVVFERTPNGRSEAVHPRAFRTGSAEHRLLLAVNGFTCLRVLLDMYPADIDVLAAIRRLLELALVAPVKASQVSR